MRINLIIKWIIRFHLFLERKKTPLRRGGYWYQIDIGIGQHVSFTSNPSRFQYSSSVFVSHLHVLSFRWYSKYSTLFGFGSTFDSGCFQILPVYSIIRVNPIWNSLIVSSALCFFLNSRTSCQLISFFGTAQRYMNMALADTLYAFAICVVPRVIRSCIMASLFSATFCLNISMFSGFLVCFFHIFVGMIRVKHCVRHYMADMRKAWFSVYFLSW